MYFVTRLSLNLTCLLSLNVRSIEWITQIYIRIFDRISLCTVCITVEQLCQFAYGQPIFTGTYFYFTPVRKKKQKKNDQIT